MPNPEGAPKTEGNRPDTEAHCCTVANVLADLARSFASAGIEDARTDARRLLAHALDADPASLASRPERRLTADEKSVLDRLAARRLAREPVSRILGRRGFYGLDLSISPATLDPRPDTETVVDAILDWVRQNDRPCWEPKILDLGTGSGAILLALLANLPHATGVGVDLSPDALKTAAANARMLGLADRVRFHLSDWFADVTGTFDVIVSNPPYIADPVLETLEREVREYDPRSALSGGPDGLDAYRRIFLDLHKALAGPGLAAFEIGHDQAAVVTVLLVQALPRYTSMQVRTDLAGQPRCVLVTT